MTLTTDNKYLGRNEILPCSKLGRCPYDYKESPDRDVEGMPFITGDVRSCPDYGHICPEFMEEFGLSADDLSIRATIHCGGLIEKLIEQGKVDGNLPQFIDLKNRYHEMLIKYPQSQYPQYY